jgi:AcrR family transcriptional regulator
MKVPERKRPLAPKADTKALLLAAAAVEFNTQGFSGTDTNRIARTAGFAPQTFYRHYADKTEIFIRVYEQWQEDERSKIASAMRAQPDSAGQARAVAATLIAGHREWAFFRRSLRQLAVEDDRVRAARAASRRAQLEALSQKLAPSTWAARVGALLTVERLCDAAAEAETDDLGIDPADWTAVVAGAIDRLRGG